MTASIVKKYLGALIDKELVTAERPLVLNVQCITSEKFFTLPNEVFLVNLSPSAFMIYAYLLLIEDRRTHTCHPSYNTISAATGLAKNTAMKSIGTLLEMSLITVEPSSYFDKHGMKWKGNNLYTILPVRLAADAFHQRQLHQLELDAEHRCVIRQQQEYDRRHPRATLCAPVSTLAAPDPSTVQTRVCPLNDSVRGDRKKQDKSVASYVAPPTTSARSAGSLRGTGVGSKAERKPQIDVAQRRDPPVARHSDDVFGREKRHFDG